MPETRPPSLNSGSQHSRHALHSPPLRGLELFPRGWGKEGRRSLTRRRLLARDKASLGLRGLRDSISQVSPRPLRPAPPGDQSRPGSPLPKSRPRPLIATLASPASAPRPPARFRLAPGRAGLTISRPASANPSLGTAATSSTSASEATAITCETPASKPRAPLKAAAGFPTT